MSVSRDPLFLATAIEAVIKAGQIQLAFIDSGFQVSKKGTIDLVTEADVAVETMLRKLVAERFPDHAILGEEFGQDSETGTSSGAGSVAGSAAAPASAPTSAISTSGKWHATK